MAIRTILFALLSSASLSISAAPALLTNGQMDGVTASGTFASSFARANGISTSARAAGRYRSYSGSNAFATNQQLGGLTVNGGAALSFACCDSSSSSVSGGAYAVNFSQYGLSISIGVVGLGGGAQF